MEKHSNFQQEKKIPEKLAILPITVLGLSLLTGCNLAESPRPTPVLPTPQPTITDQAPFF